MKPREWAIFVGLIGVGCLQMVGDVFALPALKAFGAATQVAPAMKVFTAHRGYETHANRFFIGWRDADGDVHESALTPALYARITGPYNRRNVYGAALAYGPLLRADPALRPMHDSVIGYAFCSPGVMLAPLGITRDATHLRVRIEPMRAPPRHLVLQWEIDCAH